MEFCSVFPVELLRFVDCQVSSPSKTKPSVFRLVQISTSQEWRKDNVHHQKSTSMLKDTLATGGTDLKMNTGQNTSGVKQTIKMRYAHQLSKLAPNYAFNFDSCFSNSVLLYTKVSQIRQCRLCPWSLSMKTQLWNTPDVLYPMSSCPSRAGKAWGN